MRKKNLDLNSGCNHTNSTTSTSGLHTNNTTDNLECLFLNDLEVRVLLSGSKVLGFRSLSNAAFRI